MPTKLQAVHCSVLHEIENVTLRPEVLRYNGDHHHRRNGAVNIEFGGTKQKMLVTREDMRASTTVTE